MAEVMSLPAAILCMFNADLRVVACVSSATATLLALSAATYRPKGVILYSLDCTRDGPL